MKILKILCITFCLLITLSSCTKTNEKNQNDNLINKNSSMKTSETKLQNWDIVAIMKTSKWIIKIKLHHKLVPNTTTNFIALSKKWYYDNLIFHRVMKGFMIQWGDPKWTGRWWESIYGKSFDDEFHPDLKNKKYSISMANAGPNTNWSQFFINWVDNFGLDNKHSVFWQVIEWMENVDKIIKVKTWPNDRPEKDIKIINIEIKEFQDETLKEYDFDLEKALKELEKSNKAKIEAKKDKKIKSWDNVSIHYTWTFPDWEKFDSSVDKWQPIKFQVGGWQMIKWFDKWVIWLKIWEKKKLKLKPKDAYWEYDDTKTQVLSKGDLKSFVDAGIKLEVWAELSTQQWIFKILKVSKSDVTIDINHPMAWKTLIFDIEIMDIY